MFYYTLPNGCKPHFLTHKNFSSLLQPFFQDSSSPFYSNSIAVFRQSIASALCKHKISSPDKEKRKQQQRKEDTDNILLLLCLLFDFCLWECTGLQGCCWWQRSHPAPAGHEIWKSAPQVIGPTPAYPADPEGDSRVCTSAKGGVRMHLVMSRSRISSHCPTLPPGCFQMCLVIRTTAGLLKGLVQSLADDTGVAGLVQPLTGTWVVLIRHV